MMCVCVRVCVCVCVITEDAQLTLDRAGFQAFIMVRALTQAHTHTHTHSFTNPDEGRQASTCSWWTCE